METSSTWIVLGAGKTLNCERGHVHTSAETTAHGARRLWWCDECSAWKPYRVDGGTIQRLADATTREGLKHFGRRTR